MKTTWIVATVASIGILILLVSLRTGANRISSGEPPANEERTGKEKTSLAGSVPGFGTGRTENTALNAESSDSVPYTNLLARLTRGEEAPRLTLAQAEAFVAQNQRRAEVLLAAYQASGDGTFLREAMEKFPNDPRVAFAAATIGAAFNTPEEAAAARRNWLDRFKQSAPDNALADYLSAREHFRAGERDAALADVLAAAAKPMRDYSLDWMQNTEEAFREAGYSDADAKAVASVTLLLPQLSQMRDVGKQLVEISKEYRAAGDESAAQALLQNAANMGARLDQEGTLTLIQSLVGVAIQQHVLRSMDPAASFGDAGQTVQEQIDQLTERRAVIRSTAQQFDQLVPRMSERDLVSYFDRLKLFGDEAALRWVKSKYRP
jgi:hypothetical protein